MHELPYRNQVKYWTAKRRYIRFRRKFIDALVAFRKWFLREPWY